MKRGALVGLVVLMMVAAGSVALAATLEQRCTELDTLFGAGTCKCADPLVSTSYSSPDNNHWQGNDPTSRQCHVEGAPNAIIQQGGSSLTDAFATSDPAVLSLLPSPGKTTIPRVLRTPSNHLAGKIGSSFLSTEGPTGRRAFRGYFFFSPDWVASQGGCLNSGKIWQATDQEQPYLTYNGNWVYNAIGGASGFTMNNADGYNCCYIGPGGTPAGRAYFTNESNFKGKWIRMEQIGTNIEGTPMRWRTYWQNVTDNGPEHLLADTGLSDSASGITQPVGLPWTDAQYATTWHFTTSTFGFDHGWSNFLLFRNGTCPGFQAYSHILYAAWATDNNQRIGPAYEVEVGGVTPNAFSILSTVGTYGLTGVTTVLTRIPGPTQIGFIHTAGLLFIVIATLVVRRRRRVDK